MTLGRNVAKQGFMQVLSLAVHDTDNALVVVAGHPAADGGHAHRHDRLSDAIKYWHTRPVDTGNREVGDLRIAVLADGLGRRVGVAPNHW